VLAVAKHHHQAELARDLGASDVVSPEAALGLVRRATQAFKLDPEHAEPFLLGGADVSFECAGARGSLALCLRATRARGRVMLAGMPPSADLSPVWFRELELVGAYATGTEVTDHGVASTFDLALDLAAAGESDDLADTVDYGAVCDAVERTVGAGHVSLLERLAALVAGAVLAVDPRIDAVDVAVRKLRPPVPQQLDTSGVRIRRAR
jgi:dihydroneopterin aldolase